MKHIFKVCANKYGTYRAAKIFCNMGIRINTVLGWIKK